MNMFREGLGEGTEFESYHPFVILLFYVYTIGISMFSTRPEFIAVSFICAWIYSILLGGRRALKVNMMFMIPVFIIMSIINVFFTHNGETVLMYINGNRITLEALYYGIASSLILTGVIVWFSSFNVVMTADKFIYLFGRAAPVLGLTLSMIVRFIPLLKARYQEIHLGQKCMGRGNEKNLFRRAGQRMKEVSILISWSLECSIETADSMEARGYGLKGRTSFHLFSITRRDTIAMIYIMVLGAVTTAAVIAGKTSMYYYPQFSYGAPGIYTIIALFTYTALVLMPIVTDIRGEIKWRQLDAEI